MTLPKITDQQLRFLEDLHRADPSATFLGKEVGPMLPALIEEVRRLRDTELEQDTAVAIDRTVSRQDVALTRQLTSIASLEAQLVSMREALELVPESCGFGDVTEPGQPSEPDGGPENVTYFCQETVDAIRSALSSSAEYEGKVVVDDWAWKEVSYIAGCASVIAKDEHGITCSCCMCKAVARLDSLRQGGAT